MADKPKPQPNRKGVRTVFYVSDEDREALERIQQETGAPLSEILRRAVAAYVKKSPRR